MHAASLPGLVAADGALALPAVTWQGVAWGLAVVAGGYLLSRAVGWATRKVLLWRGRSASASSVFAALARTTVQLLLAVSKFLIYNKLPWLDQS